MKKVVFGIVSAQSCLFAQVTAQSMSKSFTDSINPTIIIVVAIIAVFLVAFFVLWEIKKVDAQKQLKAEVSWNKFFTMVKEKELSDKKIALLKKMITLGDIKAADSILFSPVVFENIIENFYTILEKKSTAEAALTYELIHEIRDELGYSRLPLETPYASTRQLKVATTLMLQEEGMKQTTTSNIDDNKEQYWKIGNKFDRMLKPGTEIKASFTRNGDGEYHITTKVAKCTPDDITLEHSRQVSRKQQRNWVRVDVNLPIMVIATLEYEDGQKVTEKVRGRVRNVSGGGAAIRLPIRVPCDNSIYMNFDLSGVKFNRIEGHIIRVSDKPDGADETFQHSLKFIDLESQLQEKIVRYVFEVQRKESQWR
ncbi:MAG: PilZ domain-containing protein [Fibrobacterales bacterium]